MSRQTQKLVDSGMTLAILGNLAVVVILLAPTGLTLVQLLAPLFVWSVLNTVEDVWVAWKVARGGRKLSFAKGFNFALDFLSLGLLTAGYSLWPTMSNTPVMGWIVWGLIGTYLFDGIITAVEYYLMD